MLPHLASIPVLTCTEGKTIVNLLMPDLGKLLYLALGVVVAKKVLPKLGGS